MKKTILLFVVALACAGMVSAQFRQMRPDEMTYFTRVHDAMFSAIPHKYKDWTTAKENSFDIKNFWCQDPSENCEGLCPGSLGIGDPYSLTVDVAFTMPAERSGPQMVAAFKKMTDYNDATQVATALKSTNNTKLSIRVANNVVEDVPFYVVYCPKTPPSTIPLPVSATLALKGVKSIQCPIMSSGRADMSGDYYDCAVIFLGKPVAGKHPDERSDGLAGTIYTIAFDHGKLSKPLTQNIVVTLKGDAADIDEAIRLIDWQKLYSLLDK